MMYLNGDRVTAIKRVTENDFNGHDVWVHAEVGGTRAR